MSYSDATSVIAPFDFMRRRVRGNAEIERTFLMPHLCRMSDINLGDAAIAGSCAGAVTAALIAGNLGERRIERLRAFWNFPPRESYRPGPWRHVLGWAGAISTHG
jgi:hypothetical protein